VVLRNRRSPTERNAKNEQILKDVNPVNHRETWRQLNKEREFRKGDGEEEQIGETSPRQAGTNLFLNRQNALRNRMA
jgi:hypothetical protein